MIKWNRLFIQGILISRRGVTKYREELNIVTAMTEKILL
ncbi:hypothetical protein [Dehalobacter restrictus]